MVCVKARALAIGLTVTLLGGASTTAGGTQRRPARPQPPSTPTRTAPATPVTAQTPRVPDTVAEDIAPTEAGLGVAVYPAAVYLTAYDAGRGQRYYIFGARSGFDEMVRYYSTVLDERGDRVFDAPPVHVFETGRFQENTMAFPPSVTIKDYTWNGSDGYLNPAPGATDRYPTIIQIVPTPPGQAQR
jgi:hypothetical protein